ncbi:autotransporter-associated beta strand repeat-containing protein [Pseudomonas sp. Marseille-P9899]|uniref:autotransporter-associated beta strand repeat-containing protein n=1 Tax=Pseudomonas sp. Marseille-P9899 TaxID=2730401 RepID=UPI002113E24F|nr:autotransporter-associated beta strand repeat-containing protein [Pseudomonas sp. Marseille-P9899]
MDSRVARPLRTPRSSLSVAVSMAALGVFASLGSTEALACTPYPPLNNDTVTCSSTYWLGFASSSANLTITVNATSTIIQTSGGGGAAMLANGGHLLLTISGTIDPSGLVAMPVLTSGVIAGNGSASSIIIQSDNNGIIRGTARSPSAFLTTFAGMAVEVWNAVGGQTRVNNAGLIATRDIAGLSTPTVAADNALMAIRGGGQVIMSNVASGRIIGRVAFERSSGVGNTFLNAGSIRGSLSMGAGGVNEFTAVTLGSLTGDGSTTGSLGNSLGYNLTFAPTGQVDGGAGGVNTLKLRNPGSSGTTGAVTISASQYVNFNYLEINGGTWTINGPLLSAASTSTTLAAGIAIVDNSLVFGNGSVQANGGTLQASGTNVNLANAITMNSSGLTVTGGDDLTLSGVISGASGSLTKNGAGSLTLNRLNSYSGMTNLNAGTLILGHNSALGNSTLIVGGGTLEASTAITVGNGINVTAPAMTVGGSNDITLTGLVNVGAKLVKQGTSNLTLSSSTVFSGGADLKGGTLTVGSGSALGSGFITVSGASSLASLQSETLDNAVFLNSNLTVTGSNDLQLNGVVSGSGKLIKAGTGTLILNAVNTHTGGVELQGGTLQLDAYGLGPGGLKVSGASTLDVRTALIYVGPVAIEANLALVQASNMVLAGILSGSGTITKTGISTLRLDNTDSTFNGTYDIQQGFLTNNAVNAMGVSPSVNLAGVSVLNVSASGTVGALTGSGSVAINSAATLTVGGNNQSSTFNGAFSGGGGLVKTGSGTLNLSNTSFNSGSTQVNGGTLNLSGRFSSSTVTVNSGGTLRSTGQLDGGVVVKGGGALALAGGTAGAVQVQTGGSLLVNGGAPVTTGELFISNGGILTVGLGQISTTPIINVQGNLTLDGIILNLLDAGNISNGVHRLMNYSGTLTYNGHILGSLPTGVASNQLLLTLGAGQVNLLVSSPSLPMQFWDGSNTAVSGTVEGGSGTWNGSLGNWTNALGSNNWAWASQGAVFQGAAGTVTVDAAQSVSFLQFMTDGYNVVSGSNGSLSLNPGVTGSTEVRVDAGVTATLGLSVLGGSRLDKVGNGTLVLTGNNGYYAGTRLAGGTLLVGNTNAMGSGLVEVLTGSTLGTTTALSLSNSIDFSGASTLDVSHNLTLTGTLSGLGSVTKTGAGTLTLTSGGSSFSGALTLNDGALVLTRTFALGTAALIANNTTSLSTTSALTLGNAVTVNGNLTLPSNNDLGLSGVISGAGTLIKQGNGTLSLFGSNLLTGTLRLDSGTLSLSNDGALGQGTLKIAGVSTLDSNAARTLSNAVVLDQQLLLPGNQDLTLNGVISGADGMVKDGAGTLTLNGANLYQGDTRLNAGKLIVGRSGALGSGLLNVAGNATLESSSRVTLSNVVDLSSALTVSGSNDLTLSGGINGGGTLNKTGTGSLTLSGGSTFNGSVNINGGRLISTAGTAMGVTARVDVASGAALELRAGGVISQLQGAGDIELVGGTFNVASGTFVGAFSGNANLTKFGTGTLLLTGNGSLLGNTVVSGGTLRVDGSLGNGSVAVGSVGTLTGSGTLGGVVSVADGGHLSLAAGSVLGLGALVLNNASQLDVSLGAAVPGAAGLANITGNLTLDGQLNVTDTGGFGIGVYRLFDYGGVLTDNYLAVGTLPVGFPANELAVQTSVANQVNVVVGGDANVRFWDGAGLVANGVVQGGNGVWNSATTNWTTANAGFNMAWNSTFAVFQNTAGVVTVDGSQNITGLQFLTDGYRIEDGVAGQLLLNGTAGMRVGNGLTATVDVELGGSGDLDKLEAGTLVLNGNNSYTGSTRVSGGTLRVDGSLAGGNVTVASGATLAGSGSLAGAVEVADGGHLKLAAGSVLNLGALLLNQNANLDVALGAPIPGAAGVANIAGNLTLGGTLNVSDTGGFGIGVYRLFDYGGLLNYNGLALGTLPVGIPANELEVQISAANQINLVVGGAPDLRFWDGASLTSNSIIEGGSGVWNSASTNWTTTSAGFNEAWNSTFAVFAASSGTVTVDGTQRITGMQFLTNGYRLVGGTAGELEAAGGNGETIVRVGNGVSAELDVTISGNSALSKREGGTLVLSGVNTYSGGTRLQGGTLVLGNNAALGSGALRASAGTTLVNADTLSLGNDVVLDDYLSLNGSHDLALTGTVSGNGGLNKSGSGQLTLSGNNTYQGDTVIGYSSLLLRHDNALGTGALRTYGTVEISTSGVSTLSNALDVAENVTFSSNDSLTLSGALTGGGWLRKLGSGTLTLNGNNNFLGRLNLDQGRVIWEGSNSLGSPDVDVAGPAVLQLGVDSRFSWLAGWGGVELGTSSLTVERGYFSGSLSGGGNLNKVGSGSLVLDGTNHIGGAVNVDQGDLYVNGPGVLNTTAVSVANGARLGGDGIINAVVGIADGGHLSLTSGSVLTTGSLTLGNDANLDVALGAALPADPGLLKVNGNLALNGKLNVTDIGGFGLGVYRLIDYTGFLTNSGLAIGSLPGGVVAGDLQVQTSVDKQINLVVGGATGNILFWDGQSVGNGAIDGGSGTWSNSATTWSNVTGNFNQTWNSGYAVFQGAAGTVSVDGAQSVTGLQFTSDGYTLTGGTAGQVNLVNGAGGVATVRVSDGSTATLSVDLGGSGTLSKMENGTLVLNGNNSYSGGTTFNGGTLVVGSDSALGSGALTVANASLPPSGPLTLDSNTAVSLGNAVVLDNTLLIGGSHDLGLNGVISGSGVLVKNGSANLTLGGNNTYAGGTQLTSGSLTLGHNAALGSGMLVIAGQATLDTSTNLKVGNAVAVSSQLTVAGSHDLTLSGVLSGSGNLIKNGSGQLLLSGANTFTGNTAVNAGNLTVSGSFASANVQVAGGASLGGSGTLSGRVSLADGASLLVGSASAPLTVGNLSLASGSNLNAALGQADASTTLVKVTGDLTFDGTLNISDAGGFGIGVYQLFSYDGTLTNNGLDFGSLPIDTYASQLKLQTSIANQINLVVENFDGDLLFWNGDKTSATGSVNGGSGIWGGAASNWTNSAGTNAANWGRQFAVFGGKSGTVTVEGVQGFSGMQFLSDGYQILAAAGEGLEPVNGADGSLAVVRVTSGSALIGAQMSGSGGIEKRDAGTLILAGNNTYSGGTTVSGGTLEGSTFSLQGNILNNANLVFQQAGAGEFNGLLSGTGAVFKRGVGTLLLKGNHDFSGSFTVEQGVLQVGETDDSDDVAAAPVAAFARMALFAVAAPADALAANVEVKSGAGLTGTGTVGSVLNHGVVSPGPNGNLTVTGNFTNASDGTLSIALTPLPTSFLAVGGTANLAGTLSVFAVAPYTGDTTYTLLTADGGITGKFDTDNVDSLGLGPNLAFIDTTLMYGANDVSLSVSRNSTAFADVALSDNQRNVAVALDSAAAPASLNSAITSMDRPSAQAAFDSLSGEIHASTVSVLLEDSRYLRETVNERMRQSGCSAGGDPRSVLAPSGNLQQSSAGCQGEGVGWIRAIGGWGDYDSGHGVASVDRDLSGFMLGFDNHLNEEWRAGIAAGYTNASIKASERNSSASVSSVHLTSYLSYQLDAFAARMGAGYSWHNIDTKRDLTVGSYNDRLKSKYKAGTAQVFGEVGYTVEAGGVALEPFAGIAYVNYDSDNGREKGGAGRLETSAKQDVTFTTVGLRAGKQFVLDNGTTLTPRGSLGWRHALGDSRPDADLRFVDGGAAFSTQGVAIARDAAVVEAGLDMSVGAAGKLGVGYSGQLASESRDHAVTVSFSMGF